MKRALSVALAASLSGCATTGVSPAQTYRTPAGDVVTITGTMHHEDALIATKANTLEVKINGEPAINGEVDASYTGDVSGNWHGQPVSASCSGKPRSDNGTDVRCLVFWGNERTVTLTF